MPIRDPDRRRAYEAEQARKRRARQKQARQQAASQDQTAPSARPTAADGLPLAKGVLGRNAEAIASLTPAEWTASKALLAGALLAKAQARLETMDTATMTPADVLRFVQAGVVLMQAAHAEESERRAEGSETFNLASAALRHPRARVLVLELAKLSRELRAGDIAS